MFDRLNELRSSSTSSPHDLEGQPLSQPLLDPIRSRNESTSSSSSINNGEQNELLLFFSKVDTLKQDIEFINSTAAEIMRIKNDSFRNKGKSKSKKLANSSLASMVSQTNAIGKGVKEAIKDMRSALAAPTNVNSRTLQVRTNVLNALTRKFIQTMKSYQAAQENYRANAHETAKRQVKIIQPDATDSEIDHMLRHSSSSDLATQTILKSKKGAAKSQIIDSFNNINSKYHDVLMLEASVNEITRMFEEFALMVEEQSELLDNIEFQVLTAKDYIDDGLEESEKAVKYQRKLRKKRCCIIVFCLCVGLGLAATKFVLPNL